MLAADRLQDGDNWVEPFNHPMIEAVAVCGDGSCAIAIFERPHPARDRSPRLSLREDGGGSRDTHAAALRKELEQWPLHWCWIEIERETIAIVSSTLPTAPVFVAESNAEARVDWDPIGLYSAIDPILDEDSAAHYLCSFEQPYGSRTIVKQIKQVAAGYRADWRLGQGWIFTAPPSCSQPYPRSLERDTDPVASFRKILGASLSRILPSPTVSAAAALSGGLDSAIAVCLAAANRRQTSTYGIILPGADCEQQRSRRSIVAKHYGTQDFAYEADLLSPESEDYGRVSVGRMAPWEELHYDMFDRIYSDAARAGHSIFLTGFGGDELLLPYWDELDDRDGAMRALDGSLAQPDFLSKRIRDNYKENMAEIMSLPVFFAQRSVMDTISGVAAQHMRHGLWPIHILATREVVQYCHSLPRHWRAGRRLMREFLRLEGLPESVYSPTSSESFCEISRGALRRCGVGRSSLRVPHLADLGWVEPARLSAVYDEWVAGSGPEDMDRYFIAIAALESTLTSIEARRAVGTRR